LHHVRGTHNPIVVPASPHLVTFGYTIRSSLVWAVGTVRGFSGTCTSDSEDDDGEVHVAENVRCGLVVVAVMISCGLVWRRKCSGVSKDVEKLLSSFQGVRDLWVEPQVQGGARV
jgi:hypothetical protein